MSEKSIEEIYEIYGEMLYKISLVMLKNTHDAEDVADFMSCHQTALMNCL